MAFVLILLVCLGVRITYMLLGVSLSMLSAVFGLLKVDLGILSAVWVGVGGRLATDSDGFT